MQRKSAKNPNFGIQYSNFMNEYQALSHMTPINIVPTDSYYLPYHAVEKVDSTTTKLCVVFDGSAKPNDGRYYN